MSRAAVCEWEERTEAREERGGEMMKAVHSVVESEQESDIGDEWRGPKDC